MKKSYLLLFVVLSSFYSCIDESNSSCPTETQIELSFEYLADSSKNVIGKYIQFADLLIYNDEGILCKRLMLSRMELQSSKKLSLSPGNYTFVVWGNDGSESTLLKDELLTTAQITTPAYNQGKTPQTNDPLYFSRKEIVVDPESLSSSNSVLKENMQFTSAHIGFKILVRGIALEDEELSITNLPPSNNFGMEYTSTSLVAYKPQQKENTVVWPLNGQFYELNTFRFSMDNILEVRLQDSKTNENLIDPIVLNKVLENQDISIEETQELILFIEIIVKQTGVTVSVQSWNDVETVPSN